MKQWMRKRKRRLFLQALVQYLLFLLVPAFIFSAVYFFSLLETTEQKNHEVAENVLANAQRALTSRLSYIDELSNSVLHSSRVQTLFDQMDTLSYEKMVIDLEYFHFVSELQLIQYSNNNIAEIAVYTPDFVVSSAGLRRSEEYFRRISGQQEQSVSFVLEDSDVLSANALIKPMRIQTTNRDVNTLAYLKRNDIQSDKNCGIIFFWNTEYLNSVLSLESQKNIQIVFTDSRERVLAGTEGVAWTAAQPEDEYSTAADYSKTVQLLQGNLSLFCMPGESLIESALFARMAIVFLCSMGGLALLMTMLIYLRFRPVAQFLNQLSAFDALLPGEPYSESQLLEEALTLISASAEQQKKDLKLTDQMVKLSAMIKAVTGEAKEDNAFPEELFPVCYLLFSGGADDDLEEMMRRLLQDHFDEIYCAGIFKEKLVALWLGEEASCKQAAQELLQLAKAERACAFATTVVFREDELQRKYQEAACVLERRYLWSGGETKEELLQQEKNKYFFPVAQQLALSGAGASGDGRRLHKVLQELMQKWEKEGRPSLFYSKCLYHEMWICCLNLGERGRQAQSLSLEEAKRYFPSIQSLMILLGAVTDGQDAQELFSKMISLIDENIFNSQLSLSFLSECLEIPSYQVSRIFKKQIPCGFQEYICHRRLSGAKDLLSQSSLEIRNIARKTGFASVSAFIRTFRQYEGKTPGDYRKLQKRELQ